VDVEGFLEAMFFESEGPADLAAEAAGDARVLKFGEKAADIPDKRFVTAEID
jgi:hypothetical protein